MPTYEYRCEACGHQFDEVQKITEPPIQRCPRCKKKKVHRLISQGNFILKGTGWYVTDYGPGKGKRKSESAEGKDASDSRASRADSKSDSKSESKSEPADKSGKADDKGGKADDKGGSKTKSDKKAAAD